MSSEILTYDYVAVQFMMAAAVMSNPATIGEYASRQLTIEKCEAWLNAQAALAKRYDLAVSVNLYSDMVH